MHSMVGVWLLFSLLLFIAEPLFLHRWFLARAKAAPDFDLPVGPVVALGPIDAEHPHHSRCRRWQPWLSALQLG